MKTRRTRVKESDFPVIPPHMKTYLVVTKNGVETQIAAYDFTENTDEGRIYFHKEKDKSDKKSFLLTNWVVAVLEIERQLTVAEIRERGRNAKR